MAGGDDLELVRLPRLEHGVPQRLGVQSGVAQVDFVAFLPREARLGHDDRAARDLRFEEAVVGDVADAAADQVDHQGQRLRPLDLHRADVDLVDGHVPAQAHVHALQPVQQVGVGQREPELVAREAQQHRVVQDAALLVAENHVAGVHRLDAGHVAGDDVVDEPLRVGSRDADLPLDRDVPHRDVLGQGLVLGRGPAVLGPDVAARVVDAVVDGGPPAARGVREVPVGRLPHARRDEQLGGRAAALAQVDGDDAVGLINAAGLTVHGSSRDAAVKRRASLPGRDTLHDHSSSASGQSGRGGRSRAGAGAQPGGRG